MASSPITSWQTEGEKWKLTDFIFLGFKITEDSDMAMNLKDVCSFKGKAMTNLDSVVKSRDITLPTNVHIVKAMMFSSGHVWI